MQSVSLGFSAAAVNINILDCAPQVLACVSQSFWSIYTFSCLAGWSLPMHHIKIEIGTKCVLSITLALSSFFMGDHVLMLACVDQFRLLHVCAFSCQFSWQRFDRVWSERFTSFANCQYAMVSRALLWIRGYEWLDMTDMFLLVCLFRVLLHDRRVVLLATMWEKPYMLVLLFSQYILFIPAPWMWYSIWNKSTFILIVMGIKLINNSKATNAWPFSTSLCETTNIEVNTWYIQFTKWGRKSNSVLKAEEKVKQFLNYLQLIFITLDFWRAISIFGRTFSVNNHTQ